MPPPTDDPLARLSLPVVAAPTFLVSGPDLVIASAAAAMLGAFPTQNCRTADQLDRWLTTIAAGVRGRPWAVNLVTHRRNARLADDLRLVAEHGPPVVITALGSPIPVMEVVTSYGGVVIADVINLSLARKAVDAGVDGLACISAGADGHTGHLSPWPSSPRCARSSTGSSPSAVGSVTATAWPVRSRPAPTSPIWAPASSRRPRARLRRSTNRWSSSMVRPTSWSAQESKAAPRRGCNPVSRGTVSTPIP